MDLFQKLEEQAEELSKTLSQIMEYFPEDDINNEVDWELERLKRKIEDLDIILKRINQKRSKRIKTVLNKDKK